MTCIVGFVDRGVAYIGADSGVSYGHDHMTIQSGRKLFAVDDYLFGVSGSVRLEQVIRCGFKPPHWDPVFASSDNLQEFLISNFVPKLRERLRDHPGMWDHGI